MSSTQLLSLGFALGICYLVAGIFSTAIVDNHTTLIDRHLQKGLWAMVIVLLWWLVLPVVCVYTACTGRWK